MKIVNDDVPIDEDGTALDGTIILEWESGTILTWANNKTDRTDILEDMKDIIETSGAIILGYLPTSFLDKYGFEMRIRRLV